jgi:hypothetical protein
VTTTSRWFGRWLELFLKHYYIGFTKNVIFARRQRSNIDFYTQSMRDERLSPEASVLE